ncbi:MAG TPA: ScpA family protein [Enterovirga sp.]|jgi:segregation and condensation protein A|nr:ScpA family protein [Enterovirga sp.]
MAESASFDPVERGETEPELVVDVGGFEGPLDLLLDLARRQKVDLHAISVLALAEQYIAFIEEARDMRLELAADYLVMAAWLAFLKSRLLLPEPPKAEGPSAGDLATALAFRLRRLEAVRAAAQRLAGGPQLGRDVFVRGAPEPMPDPARPVWQADIYDLLSAYARQRQKQIGSHVTVERRRVWSLAQARGALERLVGQPGAWVELDSYLLDYLAEPGMRRSILASTFSAALEMVREGRAVLRQDTAFAPLMMRGCTPGPQGIGT